MSLFLNLYFHPTHLAAAKSHFKKFFDEECFNLIDFSTASSGSIRLCSEHNDIVDQNDPTITNLPFPFTGNIIDAYGDQEDIEICGDGTDQDHHQTLMDHNDTISLNFTYDKGELLVDEGAYAAARSFALFYHKCELLTLPK